MGQVVLIVSTTCVNSEGGGAASCANDGDIGHVNDSKGGGKGIASINGRIASHEGAIKHIVSFPGVRHVTGEENG
jgi:hypothetical protein